MYRNHCIVPVVVVIGAVITIAAISLAVSAYIGLEKTRLELQEIRDMIKESKSSDTSIA